MRAGVIRGLEFPVKVLGDGELSAAAHRACARFSESAKEQIEAAGGTVTELDAPTTG